MLRLSLQVIWGGWQMADNVEQKDFGNHEITLKVNGVTTVEFTEPEGWDPAKELKGMPGRKLSEGTIAIQGHDPKSVTYYKDISIKPL